MFENQQAHSTSSNARYVATWTIDIEDANSPVEAARYARRMQAPGTSAVVFDVTNLQSGETVSVDLELTQSTE